MHRVLAPATPYDPPSLTGALLCWVTAWNATVRAEMRAHEDEHRLREADPRLLEDVGLTREGVVRGALRPRRDDWA